MTVLEENRRATDTAGKPWLEPVAGEEPPHPWSVRTLRGKLVAGIALAVLLAFASLVWSVYGEGGEGGPPPLVAGPSEPFRIVPAEAGGMEVPHRDKLVFNRVSGGQAAGEERLAGSPEDPMPRPQVPILTASAPSPTEVVGAADTGSQAPASQETPQGLPRDAWAIQVAAFQQKREARAWMVRTKYDHEEVFGGLTSEVLESRRDMMTYYRVRFGPFPNRVEARAKCAEVRSIGLNCIVIVPE